MSKIKAWVLAARLRTLPLSVSGILVGTALAVTKGHWDATIFILTLLTTVCFQITSNFANDYGDGVKGTDNGDRIGPMRALQAGLLTQSELLKGIIIFCVLSLVAVIAVVYNAFGLANLLYLVVFLGLGILSIWAAIKYTVGKSAYGYQGFGDVAVFLFFGLLSVLGTQFLYVKNIHLLDVLPAVSVGALCVGVLNLNNLRDYKSDKKSNKNTLIVLKGYKFGKNYHYTLLITSFLTMASYLALNANSCRVSVVCLVAYFPIFIHLRKVQSTKDPVNLDPELKKLALSTFMLACLFYLTMYYFCNFI